jgi:hypothetical protein
MVYLWPSHAYILVFIKSGANLQVTSTGVSNALYSRQNFAKSGLESELASSPFVDNLTAASF